MAPLVIEGSTLGQKHRSYNNIVNDAIKDKLNQEVADINYEESDLDNLFKIDIACKNRNVEYILKILKGADMLYISRAIKRSTWLITDPQYAYIVNPTYLFTELFPQMTSKAINKFILHIRLNLKDEKRVEEFFNYYKEQDLQTAFKWLPHCSTKFIENVIEKNADNIPNRLLTRLCDKSISFLVIFFKHSKNYYKNEILSSTMFLLRNNAEKYLDIVEGNLDKNNHYFKPKFTKIIMTKCGDRIKKNFELYANTIHIPTFAKFIKKEESKDFILKHINNAKLKSLFTYDKIKPLINRLPLENRFELVKEIFIDKKYKEEQNDDDDMEFEDDIVGFGARFACSAIAIPKKKNIYSWYLYAPFNTAFAQLKKIIHKESNPTERLGMFGVLLSCAKNNKQDIYTLLKYYRENHINEPFKFKIQFVNHLLRTTTMHTFDKVAWGYLNDLFISMEVYTESGNQENVQSCIKSIILYKVIHDEVVPEIIEKKFEFDTCKEYEKKITQEENKKVFSYLFKHITLKIEQDIKDQKKFTETADVLENILRLLLDWKRELQDFPQILQKIKEIINLKRVNSWDYDITKLYNIKKSWRKLLFAESILLNPNQEACINALKHGPEVLETYKTEVAVICLSNNLHIDQFLKKIRIYWPASLLNYYKTIFFNNFNQRIKHKALTSGLCTLLSQNELLSLVNKYVPTEGKIDWTQHDEIELSLRKHIATRLHLARPQPSLAIALSYAKGDYVQYILPSLNAILYNMSCSYASENIKKLLDAPVSLQKHGIRISSKKLKNKELTQLYSDIWKLNKNSTIRSVLFCETFNILCKERDQDTIKIIWELLSMFIDNLTSEENQNIYNKLSKVREVPECVRGEFWMKSNKFLNSLPTNDNCNTLIKELQHALPEVLEFLEDDFITGMLLESLDKKISTGNYDRSELVAHFIWLSKSEDLQIRRYKKVLVPILERSFALWDTKHQDKYFVRSNLHNICKYFCTLFNIMFLDKNMNIPIAVLSDMMDKIQSNLPLHENYVLLLRLKLTITICKIVSNVVNTKKDIIVKINQSVFQSYDKWQQLYKEAALDIGRDCAKYLRNDVQSIYPTVYNVFAKVLYDVCTDLLVGVINILLIQKAILESKDFVEGHLLVLQILRMQVYYQDEVKKLETELLDEIQKHPSEEVKIHYWHYWQEYKINNN
ncbi:unnamed protein product, partial [Brenthis ino]